MGEWLDVTTRTRERRKTGKIEKERKGSEIRKKRMEKKTTSSSTHLSEEKDLTAVYIRSKQDSTFLKLFKNSRNCFDQKNL